MTSLQHFESEIQRTAVAGKGKLPLAYVASLVISLSVALDSLQIGV